MLKFQIVTLSVKHVGTCVSAAGFVRHNCLVVLACHSSEAAEAPDGAQTHESTQDRKQAWVKAAGGYQQPSAS